MRLCKTDGISDTWVRCQHPLDCLGVHESSAASKNAIHTAPKVEIPRRTTAQEIIAVEEARVIEALIASVRCDVSKEHSRAPQDQASRVRPIDRFESPVDVVIGHPDAGILPAPLIEIEMRDPRSCLGHAIQKQSARVGKRAGKPVGKLLSKGLAPGRHDFHAGERFTVPVGQEEPK
jgi:hypothetical protein